MAVTEETRHRLYLRLVEVLGSQEASTFMELVPPVGWADVATKRDVDTGLAAVRLEFRTEIAGLESRMNIGFRSIERELRLQLYWLVGTMLTLSAITVTVSQL